VHYRYIFARDPWFFSRIININREPKESTFVPLWVFLFFKFVPIVWVMKDDKVLTTTGGVPNFDKTHFVKTCSTWENEGQQNEKELEGSSIRIISILGGKEREEI